MESFDAIVIGTGGTGSSALFHLAKAGHRVLGLDQFPQAHANGSSHGQSRIIRQAYFEHPDYVPLLLRAYELWDELEQASNRKLFHQVGLLEVGPADGTLIGGVMQSVQQHKLPIETLTVDEAKRRFPFQIDDAMSVVFEPTGGYLLVEDCVRTHLQMAEQHGAKWREQRVLNWQSNDRGVTVQTETNTYSAGQLFICGGAWSTELVRDLGVPLAVTPKLQYWFRPAAGENGSLAETKAKELPTYFFETPTGCFYGFPQIDEMGLKVAQHTGGQRLAGPVDLDSVSDDADLQATRQFVSQTLLLASDELLTQKACMYTMSPDEHFIVDRHPTEKSVVFAAGLSGHGFKFTSVLGELLANLAMGGYVPESADFLHLDRF